MVGVQGGQVGVETAVDCNTGAVGEPARQCGKRAEQPEVVQHFRSQLLGDAADLSYGDADGFLYAAQLVAPLVGDALLEAFQLHEHGSHRLPDLVMQFGGDPPAFGLLRGHSPASTVAAFGLQAGPACR